MWPFREKKSEPKVDYRKLDHDKVKGFRDIGEKFNYLGVEMIVTSHSEICPSPFRFDIDPVLVCDYRDQFGKINVIKFSPSEIDTLIRENS